MSFVPSMNPPGECGEEPFRFIFRDGKILVRGDGDQVVLPRSSRNSGTQACLNEGRFLGTWNSAPCYIEDAVSGMEDLPDGYRFTSLRSLIGILTVEQLRVVGRAYHIHHWDRTTQFCGLCGSPMKHSETERAKICSACGLIQYPRISPAVIVAVVKDDKLLLAGNERFPGNRYSVLAGFVEPGETLEECAIREINEEVGIAVTDIHYFSSQPWSFPDSLMIGFTARYAGGEIMVDGEEITRAGWFRADALPNIPGPFSISRELIDWFVKNYG